MSPTATSSDVSAPILAERVSAAAALFPADGLVAGPADSQDEVTELLPSDDALVLVATVQGAPDQRLLAVVNPALLTGMGLADASGLADALAPVLGALAGDTHDNKIDTSKIEASNLGIGPIGLADVAPTGAGSLLVAAGLFLGAEHVATVGVGVVAPAESSAVAEAPAAAAVDAPAAMDLPEVASPRPNGTAGFASAGGARSLDLLRNVEMNVTAELGRTKMTVADLLSLTPGSVVELDRSAGTPIDILVNGTLIAKGEVVVIDEEFGVRISEIVDRVEGV